MTTLKAQQSNETRDRILKAALRLFNEHGATAVSTHDIAKTAELSPGNLYYHFKNKEEIIREIFYRMEIFSPDKWYLLGPINPKVGIMDFLRFFFGNFLNYRFFFREFSTLLHNDPALARGWRSTYEKLFQAMRTTAQRWVDLGILKPFAGSREIDAFIENFWIIANFSWVHLESGSGASSKTVHDESIRLLLQFLYPYHTAKGQKAIELQL